MKVDEAHSLFVLAEIMAVLAGLCFVAVGFSIQSPLLPIEYLSNSITLCEKLAGSSLSDSTNYTQEMCLKEIGKLVTKDVNFMTYFAVFFFFLGILLSIDTLFFWHMGRKKLRNPNYEDSKVMKLALIINLIYLALVLMGLVIGS